ncbi:hypothetical protein J3R30DRAFT_2168920 [Lentinula aciculospora]|uniref:Rad4-domain-containing protein n=1 Tax=Lentinula aciculospora TaxID=153920 RepID=A0A9W9AI13_9AGAR|nr:hypothetical protein J3R30DRAFT_2168920 [Lentinula aciculospora]
MSSPYRDDDDLDILPNDFDGDSDDEMDWEEVQVPEQESQEQQPLMKIVLRPDNEESSKKKSNAMSHAERMLRIDCHKIHTVLLLINARIRNKWLNDELLHARLLSLTPLALQTAFAMIHSSKVPEAALRGRMFESSVSKLVDWWCQEFFEVTDEGHIRNTTFDTMKQRLAKFVPGFAEQFEAAITPQETNNPSKLKSKGKGKEEEKQPVSTTPLIDSSDLDLLEDILDNCVEPIKSPKSLMKHALMQSGSRDTSAQLFTALCRALNIPARLVVSLQSVPWKAAVGRAAKKYPKKVAGGKDKGKEREVEVTENHGDTDPVVSSSTTSKDANHDHRLDAQPIEKSEKAKGKEKAKPPVKLRKGKSRGNVLGNAIASTTSKSKKVKHDDPHTTPPTYWTEVFSKADSQWIPVDPIRGLVNKRHVFDPSPSSSSSSSSGDNRLLYVIAFEEDGYARDVTRRYAKEFSAKVAKVQGGSTANNNRSRVQWWEGVLSLVTRPFRLNRDDIEDDEFETAQLMEGMPTSITGFKDHPLYVLPRHLKQNETIYPPPAPVLGTGSGASTPRSQHGSRSYTPELGKFRGEPVYPRSSIVSLKTPENWLRSEGRSIKRGETPMKYVKLRANTIGRKREIEIIKEGMKDMQEKTKVQGDDGVIGIHVDELDSEERVEMSGGAHGVGELVQGLYARSQTELYVPDPVVDGIVPKNQFGNIDLYVQTMLPRGAVHMPFKGVAKIARKLRIDFAEAVTGFEFRKRRAVPVLEGIVVAAQNEELVFEAFLEASREASEIARLKREERVLKLWTRLVHGLRIRQRLQEQYADHLGGTENTDANASTSGITNGKKFNPIDENIHSNQGDEVRPKVISNRGKEEQRIQGVSESEEVNLSVSVGTSLVQAEDVVQHFRLPRLPKFGSDLVDHSALGQYFNPNSSLNGAASVEALPMPDLETYDIDVPMDVDGPRNHHITSTTIPKTMHELAQTADAVEETDNLDGATRSASRSETASITATNPTTVTTASRPTTVPPSAHSANGVKAAMRGRKKARQQTNKDSLGSAHRQSTRLSTRKRKRRLEGNESEKNVSDSDSEENVSRSSAKGSRSTQIPSVLLTGGTEGSAPSTRVLRPRVAKTTPGK